MTDDSIATRLGVAREALETAQCFARLLESTTDIERRRYLDLPGPVAADIPVQEADGIRAVAISIMVDALDERTGAVPNPYNSNFDGFHTLLKVGSCVQKVKGNYNSEVANNGSKE